MWGHKQEPQASKTFALTPDMGTAYLGDPHDNMNVLVHTGTIKVTITQLGKGRCDVKLDPSGPFYVTATVETGDGELIALTDPRVERSPFAEGWR